MLYSKYVQVSRYILIYTHVAHTKSRVGSTIDTEFGGSSFGRIAVGSLGLQMRYKCVSILQCAKEIDCHNSS